MVELDRPGPKTSKSKGQEGTSGPFLNEWWNWTGQAQRHRKVKARGCTSGPFLNEWWNWTGRKFSFDISWGALQNTSPSGSGHGSASRHGPEAPKVLVCHFVGGALQNTSPSSSGQPHGQPHGQAHGQLHGQPHGQPPFIHGQPKFMDATPRHIARNLGRLSQ